jgi:hypothetical protein
MDIALIAEILNDVGANPFYKSDPHTIRIIADRIVALTEAGDKEFSRDEFLSLCGIPP